MMIWRMEYWQCEYGVKGMSSTAVASHKSARARGKGVGLKDWSLVFKTTKRLWRVIEGKGRRFGRWLVCPKGGKEHEMCVSVSVCMCKWESLSKGATLDVMYSRAGSNDRPGVLRHDGSTLQECPSNVDPQRKTCERQSVLLGCCALGFPKWICPCSSARGRLGSPLMARYCCIEDCAPGHQVS